MYTCCSKETCAAGAVVLVLVVLLLYHLAHSTTALTTTARLQCTLAGRVPHLQFLIMQSKAHFQAQVGQLSRQVLQASSVYAHKARPTPNKAQLTVSQPRQLLQLGQHRARTTCKMQFQQRVSVCLLHALMPGKLQSNTLCVCFTSGQLLPASMPHTVRGDAQAISTAVSPLVRALHTFCTKDG